MTSLVQLVSEWEIQLLVLLSFMLQALLFLCGCLRRRSSNRFFRLVVWTAYLGADFVATYALGLISRRNNDATTGSRKTHQLVFLWAPFLLIHLGGQDTLTAFALEENNLWLRHLLNLAVQVSLALYLFWKSANNGGTDARFLVLSMLLFVTGTIKYGERTWALWSGVLKTIAKNPLPRYANQLLETLWKTYPLGKDSVEQLREQIDGDESSSDATVLAVSLFSVKSVLSFFWHNDSYKPIIDVWVQEPLVVLPRLLDILETELGLVYDYIYTKAVVFQTRGGILLRCVSQIAFLASFLLFITSNKQRYSSIDTAVIYALFVGGFFLEVCAVITMARSPWTWAWLKARHCSFLASFFIRQRRKGKLWSGSMGQYNMHNYLGQYDDQSSSWKQRAMATVRTVVDASCGVEQKFWVSKLMDIRFVEVDKEMMRCIFEKVAEYAGDPMGASRPSLPQRWPKLGALIEKVLSRSVGTLNWHAIATLHTYTEAQLRVYTPGPNDVDDDSSTHVIVRKISRYIVYLLTMQPGMLAVSRGAQNKHQRQEKNEANGQNDFDLLRIKLYGTSNYFAMASDKADDNSKDDALFSRAKEMLTKMEVPVPVPCTQADLLETKEAWIRLLIYIAGRSPPELHATHLCRGGELLSFVWLFMALRGLGDSVLHRIEVTDELVRSGSLVLFPLFPQQNGDCVSNSPAHGVQGREMSVTTVAMEGSCARDSVRDDDRHVVDIKVDGRGSIPAHGVQGQKMSETTVAMGGLCVRNSVRDDYCVPGLPGKKGYYVPSCKRKRLEVAS